MSAQKRVERYVASSAGALVRVRDIAGAPATAVARALSRLHADGRIQRVAKGVYYVPKPTLLGPSRPSEAAVVDAVLSGRVRPRGVSATNLLGLSTQVAARPDVVVYGQARVDATTVNAVRRRVNREVRTMLAPEDAAVLEVLRDRGRYSELSDEGTRRRVGEVLAARGGEPSLRGLRPLVSAALSEPPRVRAMLGALLEDLGAPKGVWRPLRDSLNPLSRFDFGPFRGLDNAKDWQAK